MDTEVIRTLPLNLEAGDFPLFDKTSRYRVRPYEILTFRQVFIFWNGQVFRKGRVVEESLSTPIFLPKYTPWFFVTCLLKSIVRRNLVLLKDPVYLIVHDEWSGNYFHWLTDVLTRLYACRDIAGRCTLVLPDSFRSSFHHYVLKKFGIKNILWTNDRKLLYAREVVLPTHTAPAGNFNPPLLRAAVSFLVSGLNHYLNKGERIYISRRKAPIRKVLNEQEVIAALSLRGFTILHVEDFDFREQVSILHHARVLVSIHGAGLTNMMFMPAGGHVLELRKKDKDEKYNCFFHLAPVFGHHYLYQICESDSDLPAQQANIYVDLEKLKRNIALMIEEQ